MWLVDVECREDSCGGSRKLPQLTRHELQFTFYTQCPKGFASLPGQIRVFVRYALCVGVKTRGEAISDYLFHSFHPQSLFRKEPCLLQDTQSRFRCGDYLPEKFNISAVMFGVCNGISN